MDPLLVRFYRQYMQQIPNLTYPPPQLLVESDVQDQIYRYFFDGCLDCPAVYQRKVLKQIILIIERALRDSDEDGVSDQLMDYMGYLSTLPRADLTFEASQTRLINYILPEPFEVHDPPRIQIEEMPNLLAAGSNVGHRTWEASLHLAQYLYSNPEVVRGKDVVELGAGTGLVSILCAAFLGARCVLATDGLQHVVENMEKNISRNRHNLVNDKESTPRLVAKLLNWSDLGEIVETLTIEGELPEYRVVLGADLTYSPDVGPVLAEILRVLIIDLSPQKSLEALISHTVRHGETLRVFRAACIEKGLRIDEVDFHKPGVMQQNGFFHEQLFPIIMMRIRGR